MYIYPCYASASWASKKARLSLKRYDGPFMDMTAEWCNNLSRTAFAKVAALEYASKGIRINCVCPGMIDTNIMKGGTISEEQLQKDMLNYPLRRYGKPEEVAYAIIYLLSDASSFVTGSNLVIDGGYTIR